MDAVAIARRSPRQRRAGCASMMLCRLSRRSGPGGARRCGAVGALSPASPLGEHRCSSSQTCPASVPLSSSSRGHRAKHKKKRLGSVCPRYVPTSMRIISLSYILQSHSNMIQTGSVIF